MKLSQSVEEIKILSVSNLTNNESNDIFKRSSQPSRPNAT